MTDIVSLRASDAPANAGGYVPLRKTGSIRRTSSIDIGWAHGALGDMRMACRSRDIATSDSEADPIHLGAAAFDLRLTPDRHVAAIESIGVAGSAADYRTLIGTRAGRDLRAQLRSMHPEMAQRESAGYLLLDDVSGAAFVSSWAQICWNGPEAATPAGAPQSRGGSMAGVCIGLAEGSPALGPDGRPDLSRQSSALVPDIVHPEDPEGWHAMPSPRNAPGSRRLRWIDVVRDKSDVLVSAGFQDSATLRSGARLAVHEYRLGARIAVDGTILALDPRPHILPYATCPAAVINVAHLVGSNIASIRETVPQLLSKAAGCTHLNDVLRALAGVPELAAHVR